MSEYFWIVDEEDHVIGKETRENCHVNQLIHRSVYIFVINSKMELFIQKRSMLKDLYPGYYTSSASGHVNYGETYDQAAVRELKEELGIDAYVKKLGQFNNFSAIEKEISTVYLCNYDGEITINKDEIAQGIFVTIQKIEEMLQCGKKKFPPGFVLAFTVLKSNLKRSQ